MVHPHRPLAAWIQAGCTDPGTAGSESCSARNAPLGWPAVGCFAWRQRSGVTVAWAIVASFRALPALVVRVGLPPARLPLGGTLCRPPPLVEGCPRWTSFFRPPSPLPRPFSLASGSRRQCQCLGGLGFRTAVWNLWSACVLALVVGIPPPIRLRPVGAAWVARSRSPCNGNGSGLALRCVLGCSFRFESGVHLISNPSGQKKRIRVAAPGLRPRRPLSACLPSSACVVLVPPCRRFAAWLSPLCCAVACRRGACLCLHVSLRCPVCRST